jgi:hypothetical protein
VIIKEYTLGILSICTKRGKRIPLFFLLFFTTCCRNNFYLRSSSRGFFFQRILLWKHEKFHCLLFMMQISEVVNSMKDLIDYSRETGTGPMGKFIVYVLDSSYASIDMNVKVEYCFIEERVQLFTCTISMLIHYVYSLSNNGYHIKVRSSCIQFSSLPFYRKRIDFGYHSCLNVILLVHIWGPWFDPFKAISSINNWKYRIRSRCCCL